MLKMSPIELLDLLKSLERIRKDLDERGDIDNGFKADIVIRTIIHDLNYFDDYVEVELDKVDQQELVHMVLLKTAQAEQIYFDLRDAKSNGCCFGKSQAEIMQYDNKVLAAWNEVQRARAAEKLVCNSIVDNVKKQEEQ